MPIADADPPIFRTTETPLLRANATNLAACLASLYRAHDWPWQPYDEPRH